MSHNLPLGEIITTEQFRDAIHVAVAPVEAAHNLSPGTRVQLAQDGRAAAGPQPIGIVDPFLREPVSKGERFWLFLFPGTITSLRHDWTHPSFPSVAVEPVKEPSMSVSERWLRDFAENHELTYNTLMEAAADWVNDKAAGGYGAYYCGGYEMEGKYVPDKFWPHYEAVNGVVVPEPHRGSFFTCAC